MRGLGYCGGPSCARFRIDENDSMPLVDACPLIFRCLGTAIMLLTLSELVGHG